MSKYASRLLFLACFAFTTVLLPASVQAREEGAEGESDRKPAVTGEIRQPKDGETMPREFAVKGRTRGAPKGFVAMIFQKNVWAGAFFPYGEHAGVNRSFTVDIHHLPTDRAQWEVHLYVLPESDAEKLAAWHNKAGAYVISGQGDKIQPYDAALMANAVFLASAKYILEKD